MMARVRMLPSLLRPGPEGERPEPIRPGPLAGRYAPSAAMVVLFLVPYLGLSSALLPLTPIIAARLAHRPGRRTAPVSTSSMRCGFSCPPG
jgi:hypothetical protein